MKKPRPHWLTQPRAIRRLWIAFIAILAATVLPNLFVEPHAYFAIDRVFGFYAWFGLLACVGLILFAKLLGVFLKRRDTYYDR